jgi:type II restriction enzyme
MVRNLLLVPSFFFTTSAVEKRKALSSSARRAGWVGCNILLSAIAPEGKLKIVDDGVAADPAKVRAWYQHVRPLSNINVNLRGWTLDVLKLVRSLGRQQFSLKDVYGLESQLAVLHPGNRNIKAKIRQQLQVLRDLGFIGFLGSGQYMMLDPAKISAVASTSGT